MMMTLDTVATASAELDRRLHMPQRHRLLHGYPLAAAMRPWRAAAPRDITFDPRAGRGLLVGVLPHPFCNPAVTGCGFCTFPHQKYEAARAQELVAAVGREIEARVRRQRALRGRPVSGLYFGGGTANLSPAEPFRQLCRVLVRTFDLRAAEVTLEGVPAYFVKRKPLLMDIMREEISARHFRISMGIQTFDEGRLAQMGRLAFGTSETFRAAVDEAHARGFTASADLLFNLPHQTRAEMERDMDAAVSLGLDHLGLYHLVLFRGLGTEWSRDPDKLAGLPSNDAAAENWLALRERLHAAGFYQATLTNFERAVLRGNVRRFVYEEFSFEPDRYEMLGFGPSAISFAADREFETGLKVLNPDAAGAYLTATGAGGPAWDRYFEYGPYDLRVFYLTRRLAALEISRARYRGLFGSDPLGDFSNEFAALRDAGLVEVTTQVIRPTPRGMFYADSIASLLAWRRVRSLEADGPRRRRMNSNAHGHM